jgi:hypothetical protein
VSKAATLSHEESHYKEQAQNHLSEARRILQHLATERRRSINRRAPRSNIIADIKAILQGA